MPFTIHEAATKKQMFLNVMRPQEPVPDPLPANFTGTIGQGLPVKFIEHMEFPCVVYKHPVKPFRIIEHRNAEHAVVHEEQVATEHKAKAVHCSAHASGGPATCAECQKELEQALAKGWRREPYIPAKPPSVEDDIYGKDDEDSPSLPPAPARSTRGTAENPL